MSLLPIPPLGTINGVPSDDTESPLYLPPSGYYQADDGSIVPMNTPSSTAAKTTTPSSGSGGLFDPSAALQKAKAFLGLANSASGLATGGKYTLEDTLFLVIGLILIVAGIFGFEKTATVIQTVGSTTAKAVRKGAEIAAT